VIGSVRGCVVECSPTGEVLLEVNGLGYRVLVPTGTLATMRPGTPAFVFTHLHVREDALVLYGFASREERDLFEILIGTTGVGPKLALAMLSVHSPSALQRAVLAEDLDALTLVPGVGKRTAARLLVDLRSRLELRGIDLDDAAAPAGTARAEVRQALIGLGYGPEEIRSALAQLGDEGSVEELLRDALRSLAAARV
jgi:Holliday junction DNA helicase RuvA